MPEGIHNHVVLCWPSNRAEIAALSKLGTEEFKPTVEHSLTTCDSCQRSVWIAPQQLAMVKSPLMASKKLCYFCLSEVHQVLKFTAQEVNIGLNLRNARRRIT